jgi:hypothetical protein
VNLIGLVNLPGTRGNFVFRRKPMTGEIPDELLQERAEGFRSNLRVASIAGAIEALDATERERLWRTIREFLVIPPEDSDSE